MPKVVLHTIYRFRTQITTADTCKGTGLGLSQVYGFIAQSGGSATVKSTVGEGATVNIFLPALADSESEPIREEVTLDKIQVVDDEPDVMELTAALFRSIGYEVYTASNGKDALDILRRTQDISVLFSDVMMPNGMNGIELAQHARKLYPDIKILLASGYALPALKERHMSVDEFSFLNKPYRLADLAKNLRVG
jgi:CheY-like chemotaxis protein